MTASDIDFAQLQDILEDVEMRIASPADAIDGVLPVLVAAPRTEAAARELVAWCAREDKAIVMQGGGTKIGIGAPPQRCDIVIETKFLTEIFEHDEGNATVTVGAGLTLAALNEAVGRRGQFVPLEGPDGATLGGIVATNSFGPSRLKYGMPRDLVLGTYALLSDGRELRTGGKVVKNVSGYDLTKVFLGSYGTLGLITRVTIRLRPQDPAHWTWTARYSSWTEAEKQASLILDGPFEPTSLRLSGTDTAATLTASFDGAEAAVEVQKNRLPGAASEVAAGQASAGLWSLRAVLPISTAGEWAAAARYEGAEVDWDFGVGRIEARFQTEPDWTALRRLAQDRHGAVIVTEAPTEAKTVEVVWGSPGSSQPLAESLKTRLDPQAIFAPGRLAGPAQRA